MTFLKESIGQQERLQKHEALKKEVSIGGVKMQIGDIKRMAALPDEMEDQSYRAYDLKNKVLQGVNKEAQYALDVMEKERKLGKKPKSKKASTNKYAGDGPADGPKKEWRGFGTLKFPDGSMYQGQTENQKFNGVGRMTHANGDIYQGQFRDGEPNGQGQMKKKDGTIIKG